MKLFEPDKTAEYWHRTGGPSRLVRWYGRHPVLFTLIWLLWTAPLLWSYWNTSSVLFFIVACVAFLAGAIIFVVSRATGTALDVFDERPPDVVVSEPPKETDEELTRRYQSNALAVLLGILALFLGVGFMIVGIADPSNRTINLWSGATWLLVAASKGLVFDRRPR